MTNSEPNTVSADINITASVAQVWVVLADYNAMYTWAASIEDTESISDIKQGVGAVRRNTATGFGAIDQEITIWDEGSGFTYVVGNIGPFSRTVTSYFVQASGDNSNCNLTLSYELQNPEAMAGEGEAQLKNKMSMGLAGILEALKTRVETGDLVRPYKT